MKTPSILSEKLRCASPDNFTRQTNIIQINLAQAEIPSVRANNIHPAMFPEELAARAIRLYTDPDDVVLDPFIGSGTTALAAIRYHRHFIGFEMMEKYVRIAKRNIHNISLGKRISVSNKTHNSPIDIEFNYSSNHHTGSLFNEPISNYTEPE